MYYIYEVYRHKSFSKAAEYLYMTQPALSIAVKKVESALGAEIFDRSCHPLELTDAGRAYIDTIRSIQNIEDDLSKRVEDLRNLNTGTLRVGGTHFLNNYILAPVLGMFMREYSGIQVELTEDSAYNLATALKNNLFDITLSCAPDIIKEFEHHHVFCDHVLLAVSQEVKLPPELDKAKLSASDILAKKHISPKCQAVPLKLFKDMDFIMLHEGNNLNERSRHMFAEAGISPKIKMSIAQMVTAYRLADNGLGITFISDRMVRSPISRLTFFKIDSQLTKRQFYFLLPKRNYTPYAVKSFMEFAINNIS